MVKGNAKKKGATRLRLNVTFAQRMEVKTNAELKDARTLRTQMVYAKSTMAENLARTAKPSVVPRNRTKEGPSQLYQLTTSSDKTTSTTKNRPKLQTRTKLVKTSTSDAWRTSDLPNLFRSASSQRAEDSAINVKQEPVDYASLTVPDGKPSVTKRRKTTNSRGGKANTGNTVCKVVCCKESVASEGFCQTHSKRKRCQHEGCNNLAPKNALSDLCYRHGGRMKCQIKDCMKNAHYWELCSKHGGRPTCRNEGCDRAVYTRGLCSKHYREIQDPKASDTGRTRVKKEADRG
ncbi:Hypothetical protein PHPALM_4601 [Phytophthora palmivora]|uniref:WRKY transcription factor 19 n=1 Tax=Phytophthora palmivora TaxID=4796 RepID=A0A2P4YJF7_9STRA|nr:Hypothetical protein PHPALM_4601 [Phytophthora palmivora]